MKPPCQNYHITRDRYSLTSHRCDVGEGILTFRSSGYVLNLHTDDAAQLVHDLSAALEAIRPACNGKSPDLADGLVANKQLTPGTHPA